jgi:hypothetical protein
MPVNTDNFDNTLGGGSDVTIPYTGDGLYNPFPVLPPTSGGGGGAYTPPVPTNPLFVPPTYTNLDAGTLTINLIADETVEFLENEINVGYGQSIRLSYSPSLQFGSSRIYKANVANKLSLNYYVVSIQKTYSSGYDYLPTGNYYNYNYTYNTGYFDFNYNYTTSPYNTTYRPTTFDYLYAENITIEEYSYNTISKLYEQLNIKTIDSKTGVVNLKFLFENIVSTPIDIDDPVNNPNVSDFLVGYEIAFSSNFNGELDNILKLKYQIANDTNDIVKAGEILLSDGSTDAEKLKKSILNVGSANFEIVGELPSDYSYLNFYWANSTTAQANKTDYSNWNKVEKFFKIPSKELLNGIVVIAEIEKKINVDKPTISISNQKYELEIKDSDVEKSIKIPFKTEFADYVNVYKSTDQFVKVNVSIGYVEIFFNKDFDGIFGSKKIILVAGGEKYGTGDKVEIIVTFISVNDFPSITEITYTDVIDVPSFSDLQIEYDVIYNTFAASSVDVSLLLSDKTYVDLFKNLPTNGNFKINLRTLSDKYKNWNGSDNVTLKLTPYNRAGSKELIGNAYEIVTKINYPIIQLDEDIIKKSIFDAFIQYIGFSEPEKESKYLTHLTNFGNDEQILISSWEEDNWTLSDKIEDDLGNTIIKKEVNSLILKLYNPLPANVNNNSTFWITKLMAQPLIETIILNEQDDVKCPTIKGPNFNIELDYTKGTSTNFESLDNLIFSASVSSSNQLIQTYLSSSIIDYADLNYQFVSGSEYLWDNFVHFSSATERVTNFVYKVQLIESYEQQILNAQTSSWVSSVESKNQVDRYTSKKRQIIQGFDGFENFLYTSSSLYSANASTSLTWPYDNSIRVSSTSSVVTDWYNDVIELAGNYDDNNQNYLLNNIPSYISDSDENENFLLFMSMIGHHFDNIYYYTKSIEKNRGLGYKKEGGIADKLLFDTLKSFSWNPKNLGANSQLWNLVFGMDSNGNVKESNPAKQRTYEVWRRIVNNLPYLLKHKGTRRGVYALLSCYGIPSSNLSILEFGGPEVTDVNKSKFTFDNVTTALKLNTSTSIKLDWNNTENNRKPDTIELFVKPSSAGTWNVISGSGWSLTMSGSTNTNYGKLFFTYNGASTSTNTISSSTLPIFNGSFFGISVSRNTTGSDTLSLSVKQANKERTIFSETITASVSSASHNWQNGSFVYIGSGVGFSGSVDEFRFWSNPLNVDKFFEHVSFPEMTNGNSVSSSTEDLYLRLDFEYPKNLAVASSLINVAPRMYYLSGKDRNYYEGTTAYPMYSTFPSASLSASVIGATSITTYPYQFEAIDRSVVLEIPDVGSSRYSTNKVRFESQTLVSDLSSKHRSTKKSYDQSPVDSNRVGLFFSPTKELNIDIAKSVGGINLDNYIGNPGDRYSDKYTSLNSLRNYYFQRFKNRDIYSYINLIKLYEKSMFDDIKQILPARVKPTTGLLIEPHILERSKIKQTKPTGENNQYTSSINCADDANVYAESNNYDVSIQTEDNYSLIGENNQYDTTITDTSIEILNAESYQYDSDIVLEDTLNQEGVSYYEETNINAKYDEPTILTEIDIINSNTVVGQSSYEEYGFGLYAESGSAIRTYYDNGKLKKERVRAYLITEQRTFDTLKYARLLPNGLGDERGGYILTSSFATELKLNLQPFTGSNGLPTNPPSVAGNVISVTAVNGYLKTHYRNTADLTTGMKNSYYNGSKNTAATTLDGTPPVEVFATNPNTLRVNKAGRDSSEPILEVE